MKYNDDAESNVLLLVTTMVQLQMSEKHTSFWLCLSCHCFLLFSSFQFRSIVFLHSMKFSTILNYRINHSNRFFAILLLFWCLKNALPTEKKSDETTGAKNRRSFQFICAHVIRLSSRCESFQFRSTSSLSIIFTVDRRRSSHFQERKHLVLIDGK